MIDDNVFFDAGANETAGFHPSSTNLHRLVRHGRAGQGLARRF